jgi:hypothetical protein
MITEYWILISFRQMTQDGSLKGFSSITDKIFKALIRSPERSLVVE